MSLGHFAADTSPNVLTCGLTRRHVTNSPELRNAGHGIPGQILTDNGKVFTARFGSGPGPVMFDRICTDNGIRHILTAPYSPHDGEDRAGAVRHEARCRIPGIAGRNSEGGSWV